MPPGSPFQPRSDVDAVAENIVVIDDDVTDVNADAKFDPLVLRQDGILLGHLALDIRRTAHRINGTGKLDQRPVTGRFDDAASMGGYRGINKGLSEGL
jgi:hypothetical protein